MGIQKEIPDFQDINKGLFMVTRLRKDLIGNLEVTLP